MCEILVNEISDFHQLLPPTPCRSVGPCVCLTDTFFRYTFPRVAPPAGRSVCRSYVRSSLSSDVALRGARHLTEARAHTLRSSLIAALSSSLSQRCARESLSMN